MDKDMQLNGLEALCQITSDVISMDTIDEDEEYFGPLLWLEDINAAMEHFPDCPNLQETACRCLSALLQECPKMCDYIGDGEGKIPLFVHVLTAMEKHFHSSNVFQSVCSVISIMSSNYELLQEEFIKHELQTPILNKITYSKDYGEQSSAFEVLVSLSRRNRDFKLRLLKDDILAYIAKAFEIFPEPSSVQKQAVILLATLANDLEVVRQQCIVEEVHLILLEVLEIFEEEESLVEVTFEALGVICAGIGVPDILCKANGVRLTLDMMKKHNGKLQIQKKGIVLLQLLVTDHTLSENTFSLLVAVIKTAMENFPKDVDIQIESCVILHLVAEDNYQASVDLIQLHVHEQFFKIFENFPDDGDVLDVASSCIYLLACTKDLKNLMLLTMCALGYLKAVECLIQLGADVNCGEDNYTPFCYACRSNNLELVHFLLKHGVSDVHDALALCLNTNRDVIAGFLLKHMGHDEDGGTITLTGLKLGCLQTEWLAPALMGSAVYSSHMASNQWWDLVRKARESKLMRTRVSSSYCSTLEDDEDSFVEETYRRISPRAETSEQDSPLTSKRRYSLPDSRVETGSITTPERSELPDLSEERSSVDSDDRSRLRSLSSTRLRTVSGASIPYSPNDMRLVTVQEGRNDISLPEPCDLDEAFCSDETKHSVQPRSRRYSDSFHLMSTPTDRGINTPLLFRKIINVDKEDAPTLLTPKLTKRFLPRSKSGSVIEAGTVTPAANSNPVHRLDLSCNEILNVGILAARNGSLSRHLSMVGNLDLSHNKLDSIPNDLNCTMPRLRHLVLRHNHLSAIPACVFTYSSLERLDLSHNNIADVKQPKNILSNFVSHLDLSHNMIKEFPTWFGGCFKLLTFLDLSFNWLDTIPDVEFNKCVAFNKLQSLNLSHNSIRVIPATFMSHLKDLESFKASDNGLKSLPESIAPFLAKLSVVKLSNNKLIEKAPFHLTKFVLLLPNVHTVDLSGNGLHSIAGPLGWATQRLKDLNVSHNEIKSIDLTKGTSQWAFLTRLDLSFNRLKQIPKGLGELKSLGQLNVSGNTRITVLPDEMGNLGRLWEFLHNDLKLDVNASILRGRTRDLVGHLHARLKNSASSPQRKVVICGPRASGKSTLLRLLALNKVWKKVHVVQGKRKPKGKDAIECLDVQKWLINDVRADCRCCSRRNITLILRMWEFSGCKASVCLHRCFLSESALHILVYDVSAGVEEVEKLKPWLANIHDQYPGSGVVLVGTHLDKVPALHQQSHLKEVFDAVKKIHSTSGLPEIRGHFAVSCMQKDSNMDGLARRLLNLSMACNTKGNQVHNHRVPKTFTGLQEIIEGKVNSLREKAGVFDLGFLRKLVQDSKLDINQDELNEAIVFLRQSGLLVNYAKPAAKLNELFFLSPPRLAALIAKVITFVDPVNQSELIERDSLHNIVIKEGFSDAIVPQILRLLEDFEIALPVSVCKYLVTSNLSEKPPHPILPMGSTILRRRYSMSYVPVGLWRRLLVHLLVYSEEMVSVERQLINEQKTAFCEYWVKGFSAYWSSDCRFLVQISDNVLEVIVPANRHGRILLGNLVYHVDTLFREWFPDLCGLDPRFGYPMVRKTTVCITCQEHEFFMEDCVSKAKCEDVIECPVEHAVKPLRELVPDVLLAHLDQRYLIEESDLDYERTPEAMLGEGGFGSVYRAKYKDRNVAAKVFRMQLEIDPREHLEQEVRFLAKLRHPSIIDLVGMCLRPCPIAVLELAPLGSLNMIFRRDQKLSRGIQHRIAMQVAEGLAFLHRHSIVYRDLKPHNILIFSLAAGTLINAKISDFGSSRYATPGGFIASEGTAGYRAPEVARGDVNYNEKADIFSLGMLLYELATGGKQPFSDLKFRSELDEAVITGRPVDPIVVTDAPPWPDMQDMLDHMLEAQPEDRPTANQVYQRLSDPEFISLKQDIAVCKGQAVECMAVRSFTNKDHINQMEVWIGSGASDWVDNKNKGNNNDGSALAHTSQLSRLDLSCSKPKGCKGMILQDGRIMCIASIGENMILVGTQTGNLWVYDNSTEQFRAVSNLPDAVLCLRHTTVDKADHVFAGLANGQLAMYDMVEFENPRQSTRILDVGASLCCLDKPMMCLSVARKKLLCGVGHNVVVFKLDQLDMLPEYQWSVAGQSEPHKGLVSNIVVDKQGVWTSTKGSSLIKLWDFKTQKLRAYLNCEDVRTTEPCEESSRGMRVVSLLIHSNVLWVGTGCGRIILIDTHSMSPLMTMNRHKSAVRCLTTAVLKKDGKLTSVVLSGGLGFLPRQSSSHSASSRDFGYVLVWESGIDKESEHLHEYKQRRQEWLLNHFNREIKTI